MNRLHRVISGGQTGVDCAGLDAALIAGLDIGGYVPKGRLAEAAFYQQACSNSWILASRAVRIAGVK